MRIKGTSNPCCKLCVYAFSGEEKNELVCKLKNEKTSDDDKCRKFSYDIYKYEPRKKEDFSKFSKEDFEI